MAALEGRFVDVGQHDLPVVLFLHAYPYHSGMWAGQVRALAGRARCLTLDARGMSPGSAPPTAYLLEHLVDDALALLDQQGVESCFVCGLSLGGYVALRLCQRASGRVSGLLLANTQPAADSDEAKLARANGLRLLWSKERAAFADAQLERQLPARTMVERPELVASLREMIDGATQEALSAAMVALATRTDLVSYLPEIRVRTTVVAGADDVITTPATVAGLAAAIPGAKLHTFAGVGHLSNLEAEQDFNALLRGLIAG